MYCTSRGWLRGSVHRRVILSRSDFKAFATLQRQCPVEIPLAAASYGLSKLSMRRAFAFILSLKRLRCFCTSECHFSELTIGMLVGVSFLFLDPPAELPKS